jgi:Ran GTPase-activating protein (RanGAP) involved in mRNA processing and transport
LKEWKLTNRDIWIVIKEAIINRQCTQLWLNSNKITFIGASILADALNDNKTLEWINLDNNQLGDRGIYFLVKTLSNNNNVLHTLHLRNVGITDQGAKYLVEMIQTNKTLIIFQIGMNQISDDGILLLVNAIKNDNTTIRWLDLSENNLLTDLSVNCLLQMIEHNQSLKTLIVHGCNLSTEGKYRLKLAQQSKKNFIVHV